MTAPPGPARCRGTEAPKLLDLFSGAGGAGRGYQLAGFHVTGVDHKPQPRFAGDAFVQADALDYLAEHGREFDAIHASPPCQAYVKGLAALNAKRHGCPVRPQPRLIEPVRAALQATGRPYVIENVMGAPLVAGIVLCGSSFGLKVRRHRLFESNVLLFARPCRHAEQGRPIGVYGDRGSWARRTPEHGGAFHRAGSVEEAREAMGIDWMTWNELTQAIPPAYTLWIGRQLLATLRWEAA